MAEIKQRGRNVTRTPELSPVSGASDIQAGFGQLTGQLGDLTGQLLERKKRLDKIDNNTWLINTTNDYQRMARETYTPLLNKKGEDTKNNMAESADFFRKVSEEITKNAPDDEYKNLALQKISQLHNSYEDRLIIHQTKEIEAGNLTALGNLADEEAETAFTNGGTVEAIEQGIMNMQDFLDAYQVDYGKEKADELRTGTAQHIANTAINKRMRVNPEQTIADLEAGKYSKYITQEDREKHLSNARKEAKWQKDQQKQATVEAQDDALAPVVKNPSIESIQRLQELWPDDAKWQATTSKMENDLITTKSKQTRQTSYVDTMEFLNRDDVDPGKVTDQQIMNMVGGNLEDFTKVKSYRDNVLNNPSHDKINYKITLDEMKDDYEAGLYGDFGTVEALDNYSKQLETMRLWAIKNPDKNPQEHYRNIVAPQDISTFDRVLDSIPVFNLFFTPTPTATPRSTEIARQEAELRLRGLPAARRAKAQELLTGAGIQANQRILNATMTRLEQIENALRAQGRSDLEIANMTIEELQGIDDTLDSEGNPIEGGTDGQ